MNATALASTTNSLVPKFVNLFTILQTVSGIILFFVIGQPGKPNVWTSVSCLIMWFISALLLLLLYSYSATSGNMDNFTAPLIAKFLPILFVIAFLGYYIYKLSVYIDVAASGHLPPAYYTLSYILIGFMGAQFSLLYHTRHQKGLDVKNTSLYILILSIFTAVTITSLDIVLKFFTTDGFMLHPPPPRDKNPHNVSPPLR